MFNYLIQGIFAGLIFSLLALGYTLVYGVLRLINFAHSEVLMTGGFAGYFYLHYTIGQHLVNGNIGETLFYIVTGVLISGVAGTIVAVAIERFAYRPLRRRNAPKAGVPDFRDWRFVFLLNLAGKEFGRYPTATSQPFDNHVVVTLWGGRITMYDLVILAASLVLLLTIDWIVSRTKMGRAIRAVAQDVRPLLDGCECESHDCQYVRPRRIHGWRGRFLCRNQPGRRLRHGV